MAHYLVDLDRTLARYDGWAGKDVIGEPIPKMLDRIKQWLAEGVEVKIFTARASVADQIPPIKQWLVKHGLPDLEVVNHKDFSTIRIYDDIAAQVIPNTGVLLEEVVLKLKENEG